MMSPISNPLDLQAAYLRVAGYAISNNMRIMQTLTQTALDAPFFPVRVLQSAIHGSVEPEQTAVKSKPVAKAAVKPAANVSKKPGKAVAPATKPVAKVTAKPVAKVAKPAAKPKAAGAQVKSAPVVAPAAKVATPVKKSSFVAKVAEKVAEKSVTKAKIAPVAKPADVTKAPTVAKAKPVAKAAPVAKPVPVAKAKPVAVTPTPIVKPVVPAQAVFKSLVEKSAPIQTKAPAPAAKSKVKAPKSKS